MIRKKKQMELLAPAGTLAAYETAVESGADAVYIGAPALNARALARNFTWPEVEAMIDFGRQHKVKTYMAMNSLLKENELPLAVETLARLADLKPDALIIQDLGIYRLVRKYFPGLRIHASTILLAHNSWAVKKFVNMGFSRVVLARELTLAEIKEIAGKTGAELEVFVHGALCFSYSGLCLFSSFLGGKSGLRGACVQPCRRRYSWEGKGKKEGEGPGDGYFFSMGDLCGIDLLPELRRAGVTSLKIEGRLKSPEYVGRVVKAYRMVLDSADHDREASRRARELLDSAMGRRITSGYLKNPQSADLINPYQSGNIGLFGGKVTGPVKNKMAAITLKQSLAVGDRLRLHQEKSGERLSFTLKKIMTGGKTVSETPAGRKVLLEIPAAGVRDGDLIYKVDTRKGRKQAARKQAIVPGRFSGNKARSSQGRVAAILKEIVKNDKKIRGRVSGPRSGKKNPPLWLKTDNLKILQQRLPFTPERLVLRLNKDLVAGAARVNKKLAALRKKIIWALPPVILEEDSSFYLQAVARFCKQGFKNWQLGHIGQTELFAGQRGINLAAGYTLNILNSQAARVLHEQGIGDFQLSLEADRENIGALLGNMNSKDRSCGMTVYGRPSLFTARLKASHFRPGRTLISPKNEKFTLCLAEDMTQVLPEEPFSLLSRLDELYSYGVRYAVIDLSFSTPQRQELGNIGRQLAGRGRIKRRGESAFNYYGGLK